MAARSLFVPLRGWRPRPSSNILQAESSSDFPEIRTPMQRREFLASATTLGALTVVDGSVPLRRMEGPAIIRQRAAKPIIVSSSNGGWFRNGGTKTAVELAYEKIMQGTDVLDALVAGVNIDE